MSITGEALTALPAPEVHVRAFAQCGPLPAGGIGSDPGAEVATWPQSCGSRPGLSTRVPRQGGALVNGCCSVLRLLRGLERRWVPGAEGVKPVETRGLAGLSDRLPAGLVDPGGLGDSWWLGWMPEVGRGSPVGGVEGFQPVVADLVGGAVVDRGWVCQPMPEWRCWWL